MSAVLHDMEPVGDHRRRRRWLYVTLIVTLAATAWLGLGDDDSGSAVSPSTARARAETGARVGAPMVARGQPPRRWPSMQDARPAVTTTVDALAWSGQASTPAAPPAAAPAEPKPFMGPVVPPVPAFGYALIGRLDDGQAHALLTGPLRSFDVRAGDVLDGQWRIDAVTTDGLTVTWLPAGKRQQIGFKSS